MARNPSDRARRRIVMSPSLHGWKAVNSTPNLHEMKCRMLENTSLFDDVEFADLRQLADYMTAYETEDDSVIFNEGEAGDFVCLVLSGRVDIFKEITQSERKLVSTVGPGKFVGEMAFVDNEPRSATASARADAVLGIITRDSFTSLIGKRPALGVKVLMKLTRMLSQRLRQTTGMLVQKDD